MEEEEDIFNQFPKEIQEKDQNKENTEGKMISDQITKQEENRSGKNIGDQITSEKDLH